MSSVITKLVAFHVGRFNYWHGPVIKQATSQREFAWNYWFIHRASEISIPDHANENSHLDFPDNDFSEFFLLGRTKRWKVPTLIFKDFLMAFERDSTRCLKAASPSQQAHRLLIDQMVRFPFDCLAPARNTLKTVKNCNSPISPASTESLTSF